MPTEDIIEEETPINQAAALWTRSQSDITEEESILTSAGEADSTHRDFRGKQRPAQPVAVGLDEHIGVILEHSG